VDSNNLKQLFKNNKIKKLKSFSGFYFKKTSESGNQLDKKLVYSLSKSRIPSFGQIKYINNFLSKKERLIFKFSILIAFSSFVFLLGNFYFSNLDTVPVPGGRYTEGLIGVPKHINPLYSSVNDVDADIASLVFSSMFKRNSNGDLIEDVVDEFTLSEDRKDYIFKIKQNILWHDGETLNASDILFTFNAILNPNYQSPLRASFYDVVVSQIDDYTVKFSLPEPYSGFKELLTFGIIPEHLWSQIPVESTLLAELNIEPTGSGAYIFKSFVKDKNTGKIMSCKLLANNDYYGDVPYIEEISFLFFPNFEETVSALNEGLIDGISYLPYNSKDLISAHNSINFHDLSLTQLSLLYLNDKSNPALEKKEVRQALAYATDKDKIIDEVFLGNVVKVDSPISPLSFAYKNDLNEYAFDLQKSIDLLAEAEWTLATITSEDIVLKEGEEETDELKVLRQLGEGSWMTKENADNNNEYLIINLSVMDTEKNLDIAEIISESWKEIGIKVFINKYSAQELNTNIIPNRDYQVLLYALVGGFDPDVYAFWHSSQIGVNGLNISGFSNQEVDILLNDARGLGSQEKRKEKYFKFQEVINEEVPAIFLYSPKYLYTQKKIIKNFGVKNILFPSDRFADVNYWYINTGKKVNW